LGPGRVGDDDPAVLLATLCCLAEGEAAPGGCFLERLFEAAATRVVGEREAVRVLPDEADELGALSAQERHGVAAAPARRDPPDVRDEPDAADDGRRRDRATVRLVVERDVARDDGDTQLFGGCGDRLDRLRELPADLEL